MEEALKFATVIAPVTLALVQMIKLTSKINKRIIPLIALAIGLVIGILSAPLSDLDLWLRMWSGGFAGLSAVGLYELAFDSKGEKQ